MQRTVALVDRPEATSCPMVLSTAALGARRLGWLSSSPNTRYLSAATTSRLSAWSEATVVHPTQSTADRWVRHRVPQSPP